MILLLKKIFLAEIYQNYIEWIITVQIEKKMLDLI